MTLYLPVDKIRPGDQISLTPNGYPTQVWFTILEVRDAAFKLWYHAGYPFTRWPIPFEKTHYVIKRED
jgi:hypothetical protein